MLRWLFVAMHLLAEASAARRDSRIRFLKAQVEILRRKLGGNRVIPSPDDRARLLAIGQELDRFHNNSDRIKGSATEPYPLQPRGRRRNAALEIGCIRCHRFLGGLLRHYYREGA